MIDPSQPLLPYDAANEFTDWAFFDEANRLVMVAQVQQKYPNLEVRGFIDYSSAFEPLLWDTRHSNWVSLSGEVFPAGDGGLNVTSAAPFAGGGDFPWLLVALVAAGVVIFATR